MTTYTVDKISVSIAEKLREAEKIVAMQHGDFTLFGLFELEESPGKWDLVAAAPWLETRRNKIADLIEMLGAVFDVKDWKIISAVVPMKVTSDFVQAITQKYDIDHSLEEIGNTYVNGTYINHAFIITSNKSPVTIIEQSLAA